MRFIRGHQFRAWWTPRDIETGYVEEDRGHVTPCHIWQGALSRGYAVVRRDGRTLNVAKLRYEARHGPMPGLVPDHLCRVRACVNPDHIEPVTQAVNVQRGAVAKVTPAQVVAIRDRRAAGELFRVIAAEFGISATQARYIALGKSWANVPGLG